jgi:molybdopterin biosynthesis enzyme
MQAVYITTGALLPEGFDTVVPIEDVLQFDEKMVPVRNSARTIKIVKKPNTM